MDDFKRIMGMEGVRPLDQPKVHDRVGRRAAPVPISVEEPAAARGAEPAGFAWATGPRARVAFETALERIAVEVREGRTGWATGIHEDGTSVALPASSGTASLLAAADRKSLRLLIVGGRGWTFVMHPTMGIATLDEDPA